jgi:hypothetical protein
MLATTASRLTQLARPGSPPTADGDHQRVGQATYARRRGVLPEILDRAVSIETMSQAIGVTLESA